MMDEANEGVRFASDDDKRAALLAWMNRVDLGAVFDRVMRDRKLSRELGYEVNGWHAMQKRWQEDDDR